MPANGVFTPPAKYGYKTLDMLQNRYVKKRVRNTFQILKHKGAETAPSHCLISSNFRRKLLHGIRDGKLRRLLSLEVAFALHRYLRALLSGSSLIV